MPSKVIEESCSPFHQHFVLLDSGKTYFAHEQIRVRPADSESTVRAKDGFFLGKPPDISQQKTLDDTPSEWRW